MAGDLHTHTNLSDGSSEIDLLPFLAARAGLHYLAISDHDSVQCIEWAQAHCCVHGVRLLPAAELTCFDTKRGRQVHMLCYCPQLTEQLKAFCDLMGARRNAATDQSILYLEKHYPQFTRQAAKAFSVRSGVTYKTHLIRVLYEYGYTDRIYGDLYRALFGKGGAALCSPAYESVDAVLDVIQNAGGVAVLAHPGVYDSMELARQLAQEGRIDGVEIEHPRNSLQVKRELVCLAHEYGLIVTGGSDFHGIHMSKPVPLGACTAQDDQIERILELAERRRI